MGLTASGAPAGGKADEPAPHHNPALVGLALAALGIVYGDIGTSPLYTLKTVFDPANGLPLEPLNVIGIVSLIFWSLTIVVSLKYVTLILRANNHGEGGIMALLALAASSVVNKPRLRHVLLGIGVMGAALFYGDGVITPAISVLSAVEGLEVATPLAQALRDPDHAGRADHPVRDAKARHVGHRRGVRPGDGGLVHRAGRRRRDQYRGCAAHSRSARSARGPCILPAPPLARVRRARRRRALADGRRGAICRHGPLRRAPDPPDVVRHRLSRARAELSRTGRTAALRPVRAGESVLPALSAVDALSDGRPLDRRDGDRLAGRHLRHLFDDQAGDATRLPAAHERRAIRRRRRSARSTCRASTGRC